MSTMTKKEDELLDEDFEEDEDAQKNKYLIFRLSNEEYAIEIYFVREIIGLQRITEVPDTPDFLKGVINLRGKIIPVIDVRTRFNLGEKEYTDRTCIIVVNFTETSIGLIVDSVSEVLAIPEDQIEPPPKTNKGSKNRFVKGMGKVGEHVKIILNLERFLGDDEIEVLRELEVAHEEVHEIHKEHEEVHEETGNFE